jgi:hypothetical protein
MTIKILLLEAEGRREFLCGERMIFPFILPATVNELFDSFFSDFERSPLSEIDRLARTVHANCRCKGNG